MNAYRFNSHLIKPSAQLRTAGLQAEVDVYHIELPMVDTTQMALGSSSKRKRTHSKGRRKTKSERKALACSSSIVRDKDGNELSPDDIRTIDSFKHFLQTASLETSNAWDIAQTITKRLNDSTAKIVMIREILLKEKGVKNRNPKAAAHYAKRLHLTGDEFLKVALSPVLSESDNEHGSDDALLIVKPLCIAKFILEYNIHELLTPELCFQRIIRYWLYHLYGNEDGARKRKEKVPEMETACRLLWNASVELQRCSFAYYLQPTELSKFPVLLNGYRKSGIQSQMSQKMQAVREDQTVETSFNDASERILQGACQNEIQNEKIRREVERSIQLLWSDASVYLFGSAATKLIIESETTDLDLVVILSSQSTVFRKASASLVHKLKDHLESIVSTQSLFSKSKSVRFSVITNARIPIARLCIEYDDRNQQIDICINNIAALWNTKLISYWIGQGEEHSLIAENYVYIVSLWVRCWMKQLKRRKNAFISELSSYGLQLLILFFFQQKYPGSVPKIDLHEQYQQQETAFASNPLSVDFESIHENIDIQAGAHNAFRWRNNNSRKETLILLMEFFHYYCFEFNWNDWVVSLRFSSILSKKAKSWNRSGARWREEALSLEDPIEIERDLGILLKRKGQIHLKLHFLQVCYQLSALSAEQEAGQVAKLMTSWVD